MTPPNVRLRILLSQVLLPTSVWLNDFVSSIGSVPDYSKRSPSMRDDPKINELIDLAMEGLDGTAPAEVLARIRDGLFEFYSFNPDGQRLVRRLRERVVQRSADVPIHPEVEEPNISVRNKRPA